MKAKFPSFFFAEQRRAVWRVGVCVCVRACVTRLALQVLLGEVVDDNAVAAARFVLDCLLVLAH